MFAANTYDMLAAVSVGDRSGCTTQRERVPEREPGTAGTTANGRTVQRRVRRRVLATS